MNDRYSDADIASFYATGQWLPTSLAELVADQVAESPARVMLHDEAGALTVGDLQRSSAALATGLRSAGVRPGDRVSVQIPNWVEFAVITVALSRLGAVMVPIMPFYRRAEVEYVLEHAGVSVAVTSPRVKAHDQVAMYADLLADVPLLREVVVVRAGGALPVGMRSYDDLMWEVDDAALTEPGAHPDVPFAIVYSSGTTARPKGCVHTLNTLGSSARGLARAIHHAADDVTFGPAPVTHTQGLINAIVIPLLHGSTAHVMDVWDSAVAVDQIARHRSTVVMTPPAMLQMVLDSPRCRPEHLASVRVWMLSGAPVPPALLERAGVVMPRARLLSAYGRTENITTSMCVPEDDPTTSLTTDGRPLPHVQVKVVDRKGFEVARGDEGDIAFRGSSHMLEYLHDPVATAELFTHEGFSRSGDLGYMDDRGYVRVSGRIKDIVIRGGMNISVRQVEDLLAGHPAVRRVAVVGMPDLRLGERICCFVEPAQPETPPSLADLTDYLRGKGLAVQKLPEHLELIENMPMNPTGKIQKQLLRELARELVQA